VGDWERAYRGIILAALGPLRLTHKDLWELTWGEIDDLVYAYKYREYLESLKRAQHAVWLMNASGNLRHPVRVEDLVGYWADGEIMGKNEYFQYCKDKIKRKKQQQEGGESNG
jgi:hypothetical protein